MSFNKSLYLALGVTAGMLIASNAMADYSESFESGTAGAAFTGLTGWGGYGTYSNTPNDRVLAAGTPIATNHVTHLAVDGWVTNTLNATDNSDAQLDLLVKVALPEEELSVLSDDEAKFAMAINTNGVLYRWADESTGWVSLETPAYTEGQWIRVAVIYDNAGQRCKVSVDGNACVTATGYKAASGGTTPDGGPWYPLISQKSATTISSLKVVGTTALDDIKVTYAANSSYVPEYKDASGKDIVVAQTGGVNVPMSWFDQNSIATNVTTTTDGSGMTIADKYVTGLDPNGGEKFELKSMEMSNADGTVKATIRLPVCNPPTGNIKIQTADNKAFNTPTTSGSLNGQGSAEIPLSSGNVTYFRMVLDK